MGQAAIQLNLFYEETEVGALGQRMCAVECRMENVRKGIFARFTDLGKKYMELQMQYDQLNLELGQLKEFVKGLEKKLVDA